MQQSLIRIQSAITAFKRGTPVLIFDFDDRESETDIIHPAETLTVASIKYLRDLSGNNINGIVSYEFATKIGLLPLEQLLQKMYPNSEYLNQSRHNGTGPNFTFPIDHVTCRSGCTYQDLAFTLSSLVEFYKEEISSKLPFEPEKFLKNFRIPGHLPLLIGAQGLFDNRKGHTELGIALAGFASTVPILVTSELIDAETGETLNEQKSIKIAQKRNIPFLYGEDILSMWEKRK